MHNFEKPLKKYFKHEGEYRQKVDQASDELCQVLEKTDNRIAELACRKYLAKNTAYNVVRFS